MTALLYNLLLLLFSPVLALYLAYRLVYKGKSREGFGQRLGWAPRLGTPPKAGRVWLHAVSAGEVVAAAAIVKQLRAQPEPPEIVVSTTTPAGQQQARRLVPEARAHFYFPFDFLPCVWLALRRVRPTAVAPVETEIWPNWLWMARLMGMGGALVNGQFADKGWKGARKARVLYRWALGNLDRLWMQSALSAERARYLGAPEARVRVVGNVKFDQAIDQPRPEAVSCVRQVFGEEGRPLWIAGSTHPGEEEQILAAFRRVRKDHPDLGLIIAPRHERGTEVAALAEADGWSVTRRSRTPAPADVLILDTMGELAGLYACADVVFVGGSLIPMGGHDVLQPLFHGKPVLFGPHMHNQRDIAALVLGAGAAEQVSDPESLGDAVDRILRSPDLRAALQSSARRLLAENTGAARECADLLIHLARGAEPPDSETAARPPAGPTSPDRPWVTAPASES